MKWGDLDKMKTQRIDIMKDAQPKGDPCLVEPVPDTTTIVPSNSIFVENCNN